MAKSADQRAAAAFRNFVQANLDKSEQKPVKPQKKEKMTEFLQTVKDTSMEEDTNQILFSNVFGWVPDFGDFLVTVFDKEDWPEHVQSDIPVLDPHYVWDRPAVEAFAVAMERGHKPRLVGHPGVGKSTLPLNYCAVTNRPFARINFNTAIEAGDVIGHIGIREQNGTSVTTYIEGEFPKRMREGYLLLLDEMYRAPSGVLMALQRVFERDGVLKLTEKEGDNIVKPHEHFRLTVADNTKGLGDNVDKFGSALIQDVSSLNRFELTIEMDYLPADAETSLITSWEPRIQPKLAKQMVQAATLIREAYKEGSLSLPMSPRNLRAWAEYTTVYNNPIVALRNVYYTSLAEENEQQLVQKFINSTVFDTDRWGQL